METFLQIMLFSVMVLVALSLFGGALVAVSTWLIDNSEDDRQHAH